MGWYAIGDVHGCARTLDALLDRLAEDAGGALGPADTLVFVGDYVDRGPASPQVLDRMLGPEGAWAWREFQIPSRPMTPAVKPHDHRRVLGCVFPNIPAVVVRAGGRRDGGGR